MKTQVRTTILNALIVAIAITSATVFFLAQLRSHAVQNARQEQEERIRAFWALLNGKGTVFRVKDGRLWVGDYLLSGNNELPDRVRDIFGGTATIFQGDVRVATNVLTAEGRRAIGTRLSGPPYDALFRQGRAFRGEVDIIGTPYFSAYDPIRDPSGRVIGAIYVGVKQDEFFIHYDSVKIKVITGGLVLNVLFIALSLFNLRVRRDSVRALEMRDRKMKAILNNIPDLAWIKDKECRFLAVNLPFSQACDCEPEALVGKSDLEIWPRELAEAYRADDLEVMRTGRSRQYEERLVRSDGTTMWLETLKSPIFSAQGEIVGTTGIARDISQRKQVEEELRFTRYCVERSLDGISWIEEDGRFTFANQSMCRIFSASPDQFATLSIFDLVPGYTPETWKERWKLLATESSQTIELVARDGQGRRFPVEVSSSYLVYHGKGRVCSFVRDISERKRTEEQIQHTVSIVSATLESIADGIVVLDLQSNVVMYNKKYPQMLGIPEAVVREGEYRSMLDHVLAEIREPERFRDLLAESMAHPEEETVIVMEFNDGRIIERVSCPYLVGGEVAGIVLNLRDVTLQRRVEAHLRNAQKVEALGTLTGGIAHDFNNRLTAIIGYGSLIRSQPEISDQVRGYADLLLVSAERSAELTQGLLAYSRKQTLNPVPLALNELVRDLEKFFPPIIGEHINLCIELSKDSPVVRADRGQMEQVLYNLIGNARDAMAGVGRLTIATGAAFLDADFIAAQGYGESGGYAIISVTDTGAGIDAATLEKIFEPFFTTKEVGKGTGLGLSIVYGIVKQHEGFINVVSEPGLGTTFWIYLPLAQGTALELPSREPSVRAGRGETILLVEDDQEVRLLFREVLEHHGYHVIEALDGADGVIKFRERGAFIDLLVIDVIMPRKNGWEAFNEIRKLRGDVQAIFVSGYTYDIVNKAGLEDKGLHFMSKPVSPAMLLQKLRELLD